MPLNIKDLTDSELPIQDFYHRFCPQNASNIEHC